MENNVIREFFNRGLCLLVMALLLFTLSPNAQGLEIESGDISGSPKIWDMSGIYSDDAMFDCSMNFLVSQDSKGKITGGGNAICSGYYWEIGDFYIDLSADIKGSIKQNSGIASVKMAVKFQGTIDVPDYGFYGMKFKGSEKINAEINAQTRTLLGLVKVKACVQKAGCASETLSFSESLFDNDMLGTWSLNIEDAASGTGTLTLSNGDTSNYSFKSKSNAKKHETKIKLKGLGEAKGCKILVSIDDNDGEIISFKGKVLGQKIMSK